MGFKISGLSVEMKPSITKWGFEDLGDDPASHRWRAWWALGDISSETGGIELRAYPVIKPTRCGVWVDELAWREWEKEWNMSSVGKRFVHNDSGQAWAKPTQEQAIESLAIRLCRWTANMQRERARAESAAKALEKLRPDLSVYAKAALENLK